jgi:hypothetical protein
MTATPTTRSLRYLRDNGWTAEKVERWNSHAGVYNDLFGFIDILAINDDGDVLAVQATSRTNVASRIRKIADHPNLPAVRKAGWTIHVHGWGKMANGRVELRTVDVS